MKTYNPFCEEMLAELQAALGAENVWTAADKLDQYKTYEKFYAAVLKQIESILDLSCSKIAKYRVASVFNAPRPYKSLLTDGCMESGKDFNDSGALYDYYEIMLVGKIDRVDTGEGYFRIIDYKSGSTTNKNGAENRT